MGDGAVGLAVAHRRPVRPQRRIHQNGALAVEGEPLVGASRSVALHVPARGAGEAAAVEKTADGGDVLGAGGQRAVAGDARLAEGFPVLRRQREGDVEPVGGEKSGGAVGPFQEDHATLGDIREAEFGELGRPRQPVEIGMHHGKTRQLVGLHQRERRARHFDGFIAGEMADERAGKGGLAGAEIAGQRDQVAGFDQRGDVEHQSMRCPLVGERHREA